MKKTTQVLTAEEPTAILTAEINFTKVTTKLYGEVDDARREAEQKEAEHRANQLDIQPRQHRQ